MKIIAFLPLIAALMVLSASHDAQAQRGGFDRLPPEVFDVTPPSARVSGDPGQMKLQPQSCQILPSGETRRRIVDVAVQEWGFFGFSIVDRTNVQSRFLPPGIIPDAINPEFETPRLVESYPRLGTFEDSTRVAASIGGYWAAAPEGEPILNAQNEAWRGPGGDDVTWQEPWSAAFVSWVMCEAGLGRSNQFQRSIAHRVYIDQAIRARDGNAPEAAFVAYDRGEAAIVPGDLLCTARRPAYRSIADRRRQMGVGARSHCDVVVKIDEVGARIFAIGGNVSRSVSMKLIPAVRDSGNGLRPIDESMIDGARSVFAHLSLRADPIEANALDNSPTIKALVCVMGPEEATGLAANIAGSGGPLC